MSTLPQTATDYLIQIQEAYTKAYTPGYLVFYVSPELFKAYISELEGLARYTSAGEGPIPTKYFIQKARVKPDPDLYGHHIRILEDQYAYDR